MKPWEMEHLTNKEWSSIVDDLAADAGVVIL